MSRSPRPLSTVVLEKSRKDDFIDDIKDYLHPSTRRWMANRGIPWRRGYLLHGPPGTGKTSLCFSVAGLFGLRIYVVSLNSASVTEDSLASLFQDLPRRCIVLLEDIDTAGVTVKRAEAPEPEKDTATKAAEVAASGEPNTTTQKGVSLSALLNIIDGVASSEGRLLVMTTNHIERLDKALRRPGRVDMTIGFGYADAPTIRDLYRAIYTRLEGDFPTNSGPLPNGPPVGTEKSNGHCAVPNGTAKPPTTPALQAADPKRHPRDHTFTEDEVDSFSASFAIAVPANEFTPAEIQGYLLRHKYTPFEAVAGAKDWVCALRKEKMSGGDVEAGKETVGKEEGGKKNEEEESEEGMVKVEVGMSEESGTGDTKDGEKQEGSN